MIKRIETIMNQYMNSEKWYRVLFWSIFIIGCFLRIYQLGIIPGKGSLNKDEAYAGYEAYSLLTYGFDSHGYHMPVYLEAWGSGMNALETYCMIPFIALLGLNSVAIRLPQAILGCMTLPAFYGIVREIRGRKAALLAIFILAIMPWHIMMSRWGLESNFYPGILTIATYFLIRGNTKHTFLPLAALFYGLSLYCYASPWIVMPLLVAGSFIMIYWHKKADRYLVMSLAVLLTVAFPLLLFVMVNMGYIDQIITTCMSVPKLTVFRSNEVSLSFYGVRHNFASMMRMLFLQKDNMLSNATEGYGLYYHFSVVFILIGIGTGIYNFIGRKEKVRAGEKYMWLWLVCALILGCMTEANINQLNIIHIPLIYFLICGIIAVEKKIGSIVLGVIVALYAFSLLLFVHYYGNEYNAELAVNWCDGAEKCLMSSEAENADTVHILDVRYSLVLFYTKFSADEFVRTVTYEDPTAAHLYPLKFGKYDYSPFSNDMKMNKKVVFICSDDNK